MDLQLVKSYPICSQGLNLTSICMLHLAFSTASLPQSLSIIFAKQSLVKSRVASRVKWHFLWKGVVLWKVKMTSRFISKHKSSPISEFHIMQLFLTWNKGKSSLTPSPFSLFLELLYINLNSSVSSNKCRNIYLDRLWCWFFVLISLFFFLFNSRIHLDFFAGSLSTI